PPRLGEFIEAMMRPRQVYKSLHGLLSRITPDTICYLPEDVESTLESSKSPSALLSKLNNDLETPLTVLMYKFLADKNKANERYYLQALSSLLEAGATLQSSYQNPRS